MVLGFCNMKRSVAFMLLMVVLSNALPEPVKRSSSADAVKADFPVQSNRVKRSISTCNNILIRDYCTMDFLVVGDQDTSILGVLRATGSSFEENFDKIRGVILAELDPMTCTTVHRQDFQTQASAVDRIQFLETLESAPARTIIVGISADFSTEFQKSFASFSTRYNMDLSGSKGPEKFAFVMQKGYPMKTIFRRTPINGASISVKIILRGSTISDVTFTYA